MNRRNLPPIVIALALAFCLTTSPSTRAADATKPNIIFILADDLGYGDLGCYGQKIIQTPHIDRLATEGMKFTSFYAGNAVCAPSRCTLMTGLHSGHAFVRDNRELKPEGQVAIPAESVTVAKVLKSAGYRTGCIGKWGLGGPGSTGEPNKQGFDYFYGYLCQRIAHSYYPDYLWRNTDKVLFPENAGGKRGTYSHDELTKEALAFVEKAKAGGAGEPFFLYLPYTVPHFDLDVPEDSMAPYAGKWEEPALPMGTYRAQAKPRAAYAGMISRMDRDIGRLMELLKQKGLDDNTLVIFTSDNGATFLKGLDAKFFGSQGGLHGYKADLYEGGIRVPMIARWPGKIKPGTTSDFAAAFYDVLPTLAELAGTPSPQGLDGLSFAPTLLGKPQKPHDYLYWEFPEKIGQQAVRIGDWKGIRVNVKKQPEGPIELYDLKSDLAESKNVAAEHPDIVARMAEIMRSGRTESKEFPLRGIATKTK
jgi:arylsulfatase A-like enzyme